MRYVSTKTDQAQADSSPGWATKMQSYCSFHKKKHDDFHWKSWANKKGKIICVCREGLGETEPVIPIKPGFVIGVSKKDARVAHWKEIKKRVTTHEGEVLSGQRGRDYQKKYSAKHLGIDLSRPPDFSQKQYQEVLSHNYEQNRE